MHGVQMTPREKLLAAACLVGGEGIPAEISKVFTELNSPCSVCLDPELVQKLESIQAHARGNAARSLVAGEGKLRPAADCSFRRNPFPCTGA